MLVGIIPYSPANSSCSARRPHPSEYPALDQVGDVAQRRVLRARSIFAHLMM